MTNPTTTSNKIFAIAVTGSMFITYTNLSVRSRDIGLENEAEIYSKRAEELAKDM